VKRLGQTNASLSPLFRRYSLSLSRRIWYLTDLKEFLWINCSFSFWTWLCGVESRSSRGALMRVRGVRNSCDTFEKNIVYIGTALVNEPYDIWLEVICMTPLHYRSLPTLLLSSSLLRKLWERGSTVSWKFFWLRSRVEPIFCFLLYLALEIDLPNWPAINSKKPS